MTYSAVFIEVNNSLVLLYGILPTSAAYKFTISVQCHTITSIYTNLECYYMYTYVCTCLSPVHKILHVHQQQGLCPLQDTGNRNRTEPATQYTYVHNVPPCTL